MCDVVWCASMCCCWLCLRVFMCTRVLSVAYDVMVYGVFCCGFVVGCCCVWLCVFVCVI